MITHFDLKLCLPDDIFELNLKQRGLPGTTLQNVDDFQSKYLYLKHPKNKIGGFTKSYVF